MKYTKLKNEFFLISDVDQLQTFGFIGPSLDCIDVTDDCSDGYACVILGGHNICSIDCSRFGK